MPPTIQRMSLQYSTIPEEEDVQPVDGSIAKAASRPAKVYFSKFFFYYKILLLFYLSIIYIYIYKVIAVIGGGCLVFYEYTQTPIILSQAGTTVFTTGSPSAGQIQLAALGGGSGGISALGGSSRNGAQLSVGVFNNS